MADFNLAVSAPSLVVEAFEDPATASEPSRLNSRPGLQPLRRRVDVDDTVTLTAEVGGTSAPDDSALGGRLFRAWVAEQPGLGDAGTLQVHAVQPNGSKSSIQEFTLPHAGHYTLVMNREGGGGHVVHVDAV